MDTPSANDETHARLVADADLIYFGGGYPHVAMRILPNTRVLEAARAAMIAATNSTPSSNPQASGTTWCGIFRTHLKYNDWQIGR